jgi:hypothetical protein
VKSLLVSAASAGLVLGVLAMAQPVHAAQVLNVSTNLDTCLTSSASVILNPGEALTVDVTTTGAGTCFYVLVSEGRVQGNLSAPLTGWSLDGVNVSGLTDTGREFDGARTLSLVAGSVSARILFGQRVGTVTTFTGQVVMSVRSAAAPPGTAHLPPVEHMLGFNANGGTCTLTDSGSIVNGVWIQVPTAEQCTRPGYMLLGWNPQPDGSDPLGFDPGGWTVMTDDNTLYAIWVPVP